MTASHAADTGGPATSIAPIAPTGFNPRSLPYVPTDRNNA
jgi:hypothetical protein